MLEYFNEQSTTDQNRRTWQSRYCTKKLWKVEQYLNRNRFSWKLYEMTEDVSSEEVKRHNTSQWTGGLVM